MSGGPAGAENVIETYGLTKDYGGLVALSSVDLKVPKGAVGLLGPNGAGKSTLIKCILGLATATSGSAKVLGSESGPGELGLKGRQMVGYVPEADCLIPDMTGLKYVRFMGELSGLPPMDAMQRAHEVLHYVGIGDERYRDVKTYSTGMQQKVKLAQALVHDPRLIILDEPTNGMDPKGRQEMLDLIRDINKEHGKDILFSSHLLPDVEFVCDKVVIMDQGRVVIQGDIGELTGRSPHYELRIKGDEAAFRKVLKEQGYKFEKKGSIFIVETEEEVLNDIYKGIRGKDVQIRHATRSGMTLEDLFISKVGGGK